MSWRVGLFLFALYVATYGGGPHAVDEIAPIVSAGSLVKRGTLATNELFWTIGAAGNPSDAQVSIGQSGDVWSKKGPLVALAMVPWAYLAYAWSDLDLVFTSLLVLAPITAATGGLLVAVARRAGLSLSVAMWVGLGYGIASLAWPYARLGFGEPLIAFAVVLAIFVGRRGMRGAFLAGLCVAMATATKPSAILLGLPIALFVLMPDPPIRFAWSRRLRSALAMGSGALIGLVPLALHNAARFGTPWATGYAIGSGEDFSVSPLVGLAGLLVSPYRGVIWFVPCVVLAFFAFPEARRRAQVLTYCALGIAVVTLGTYSAWWTWWGGNAWGPRFLLPAMPLIAVVIGLGWSGFGRTRRWIAVVFIGLSTATQTLGVFLDFNQFERALRVDNAQFTAQGNLWDMSTSPILGHLSRLWTDGPRALDVSWMRNGHVDWTLALTVLAGIVVAAIPLAWRVADRGFLRSRWNLVPILVVGFALRSVLVSGPPALSSSGMDLLRVAALRDEMARVTDGTIVLASEEVPALWAYDRWRGPTYGVNRDDLPPRPGDPGFVAGVVARHARIWLMAANVPRADPLNGVEPFLERVGYRVQERVVGTARLVQFEFPREMSATPPEISIPQARFVEKTLQLVWARQMIDSTAPYRHFVELEWEVVPGADEGINLFLHLYRGEQLVGQVDAPLASVLGPVGSIGWRGYRVRSHHTIESTDRLVDPSVTVAIGLYRVTDGSRLTPVDATDRAFAEKRVPIDR